MIVAVTQNHPDLPTQTIFVDTEKTTDVVKRYIQLALSMNEGVACPELVDGGTKGRVNLPAYIEAEVDFYYD